MSGAAPSVGEKVSATANALTESTVTASLPYVGRWNTLVSTTNWEKGRIIFQWREDLIAAEAPASEYADEAWVRLVGGVTGQHVGRLRRVYQRFSNDWEKFDGLFWSHFQAAMDWDDAEMWLEGAVQNRWSVSQMRRQRWETLGAVAADEPREEDVIAGELDEDFEPAQGARPDALRSTHGDVDAPLREGPDFGDDDETGGSRSAKAKSTGEAAADSEEIAIRPFENLADLPEDLAEAFDAFKLAILRHKTTSWEEISREDVLASLDALKALATAPSADGAP